MASILIRKPIVTIMEEAGQEGEHTLKRALGVLNLIALGIGAIIGAGIFVLTGSAAAQYAGPAIIVSFILAGTGCLFAGLCYAEFASLIPIAGSAYTYGYATLGELFAWIIGWDLDPGIRLRGRHGGFRLERQRGAVAGPHRTRRCRRSSSPRRAPTWPSITDSGAPLAPLPMGVDLASLPHATGGLQYCRLPGDLPGDRRSW